MGASTHARFAALDRRFTFGDFESVALIFSEE
jgi:hypothetical protein